MKSKSMLNWKFIILILLVIIILSLSFFHNEITYLFKEIITVTSSIVVGILARDINFQYSKKEIILHRKDENIKKIDGFITAVNDLYLYSEKHKYILEGIEKDENLFTITSELVQEIDSDLEFLESETARLDRHLELNNRLFDLFEIYISEGKDVSQLLSDIKEDIVYLKYSIDSISTKRSTLDSKSNTVKINNKDLKKHISSDRDSIQKLIDLINHNQELAHSFDIDTTSTLLDPSGKLNKLLNELIHILSEDDNYEVFIQKKVGIKQLLDNIILGN